uniref:DUF4758 domain-containing protein n=1 Tax=Cacopsylla melanoneura TaxID=428564 RepID=A0A8D9DQH6_9HEMI
MLQPRLFWRRWHFVFRQKEAMFALSAVLLLGLCQFTAGDTSLVNSDSDSHSQFLANENQHNVDSNSERERLKRNLGDVNVSILSNSSESKVFGLISSAARTFVQDGITTEFTTQLLGTNIGSDYARILSTGSKILYNNVRSRSGNSEPFIIYPTVNSDEFNILPTNVQDISNEYQTSVGDFDVPALKDILSNSQDDILETSEARNIVSPTDPSERTSSMEKDENEMPKDSRENSERIPDSENVISIKKEYSSSKGNGEVIKPQKVKPKANLPTYTIKNSYDSFPFEDDLITEEPKYDSNQLYRKPVIIKNDINFEAIAKKQQRISKNILFNRNKDRESHKEKDQTSANQQEKTTEKSKLITTTYYGFADFTTTVGTQVIHFMPHTPVAAPNNLVTSIKDEATLRNELIRPSKVQNIVMKTNLPNSLLSSNKLKSSIESSQPGIHEQSSKQKETEPLFKYRSSTTRIYNTEAQALGLVKSIGGIEAYEGTTTEFTTFVYGTYINGDYKQLLQSATNIKVDPTKSFNSPNAKTTPKINRVPTTTPKTEEEKTTTETPPEADVKDDEVSNVHEIDGSESVEYVAKTSYKTYTYLTTFFIPVNDDLTTTSVKSRDVVSSIVTYVPSTIKPTSVAEVIQPSEEVTTPLTTTQGTTNSPSTTEEPREVTSPISDDSENTITTESSSEKDDTATTVTEKVLTTTQKNKKESNDMDENKEDRYTTLDAYETTESVIISTTEKKLIDPVTLPVPTPTIKSAKNEKEDEQENDEEVELIHKTLYTTYTYLTTYFEESTSSISSREEIVTNVVTSTIDKNFFSENAVEGLFERNENSLISSDAEKVRGTNLVTSIYNTETVDDKTVLTTFTYFTTFFDDVEPSVTSRTSVLTDIIKPTTTSENVENTNTVDPLPSNSGESIESTTPLLTSSYSEDNVTSSTTEKLDELTTETINEDSREEDVQNIKPGRPQERKFTYDTTMSRNHKVSSNDVEDEEESLENYDSDDYSSPLKERDAALSNEEVLLKNSYRNEYMVTNINSTRSKETINRKMIILNDSEEDQISSETNTEETEPSLLLQTSYTTFTYFTTLYKGSSSDIVSRLETVTNVVTETVQPTVVTENILDFENEDVPITYYTTFTYWTTLYKEGSTMITSREETQSNIITPSVSKITDSSTMEITPTPTMPIEASITPTTTSPGDVLEPTTYFTTYTYFTTSYLGNSTIVNSRLETLTNVLTPSETENVEPQSAVEATPEMSLPIDKTESAQKLEPTGLISTIAITDVLEGITTILSTDVFGTYIDGLYAQVLESTTKILSSETVSVDVQPTESSGESAAIRPQDGEEVKPTGVVSLNEGSIIDAEGITTTFYTTKAIGTYIDGLYAQVIESTSSIKIDEERKTTLPDNDPATTVIGDKSYKTGLVKIIEGQMVKDKTTTFYESKVIGTIIDDRYAQVIESTSSVSIEPTVNIEEAIKPTSTQIPELNITPTEQPSVLSSAPTVESSQGDKTEDEDDEENKIGSKKKEKFSPVIRPFASRPRPTFLPKKKTGEPGIAQTITRGITPTIVATPALKATSVNNVFGATSRNRFAASRRPSAPPNAPVSENPDNIRPSSSSRKFSRPSKSSGSAVSSFLPSTRRGGPSSVKVVPTPTPVAGSSRKGPNYRTSAPVRSSSELGIRSTGPNSRFRVRPTPTTPSFTRATVTTTPEPVEEDEDLSNEEEEEEIEETLASTTTTTESSRRQNPLLRLRRPPLGRTAASPTPPPPPSQNIPTTRATIRPNNGRATTTKPTTTTKRGQTTNNRSNGNRGGTTTTSKPTTTRPRPVFNNNNRPRPRPANALLPGRLPARKPVEEPKEEDPVELDEEKNQEGGQIEEEESDNFFEGSEAEETKPVKNELDNQIIRKPTSPVSIRPFTRRRNKRQADYGYRYESRNTRANSNSNRRPSPRIQSSDYYYYDDDVQTEAPKVQNTRQRYSPRNQQPVQQQPQQQQIYQQRTPQQQVKQQRNQQQQQQQHHQLSTITTAAATPCSEFTQDPPQQFSHFITRRNTSCL